LSPHLTDVGSLSKIPFQILTKPSNPEETKYLKMYEKNQA